MRPTLSKVYFGMYEEIVTQSVLVFELKNNELIIYCSYFFFLQWFMNSARINITVVVK